MKTNSIISAAIAATALLTTGILAQTEVPAPASPPGAVVSSPSAVVSPASPMPTPNSVIYIPRLPTPAELSSAAAAQSLTIDKMEVTSTQITVVYKFANGQTNTVAYALLPAAGPAPATAPGSTVVATAPTTTVVYTTPAPAYYYDPYPYYYGYPWAWPVGFNIGIGYTFHGGYYHGGFRHYGGPRFHGGGGRGWHR